MFIALDLTVAAGPQTVSLLVGGQWQLQKKIGSGSFGVYIPMSCWPRFVGQDDFFTLHEVYFIHLVTNSTVSIF